MWHQMVLLEPPLSFLSTKISSKHIFFEKAHLNTLVVLRPPMSFLLTTNKQRILFRCTIISSFQVVSRWIIADFPAMQGNQLGESASEWFTVFQTFNFTIFVFLNILIILISLLSWFSWSSWLYWLSWLSVLIKLQRQNLAWTSKSWPNLVLKVWTKD